MDDELLVNTRKRRINAGSRLKQLLSAEDAAEDDDVDLLFVEDEDDREYHSQEESGGESDQQSEEQSDQQSDAETEKPATKRKSPSAEVQDEEDSESGSDTEPLNNDEMFSDSSDESSGEDSDVGEKELEKAERAKKRELKKKKKFAPQIKKVSTAPRKPKKIYEAPKADTLLSEHRRSSSRSAAVQSKLDLVEKLKEEEQRRSTLKPVQKIEYVEMTQEERLAEAIETEKYNISTLNKYQEQENDRAVRRREMMLNKRRKLTDVMTIRTMVKYVPIEEERELEKFYLTRDVMKKKDRRGRKSEKQRKEEEEEKLREERLRERWEMLNNPEKSFFETKDDVVSNDAPIVKDVTKELVKTETDDNDDTQLISQEPLEKKSKDDSVIDVSSDSDDDENKKGREETPIDEFKDASDSMQTTPNPEEAKEIKKSQEDKDGDVSMVDTSVTGEDKDKEVDTDVKMEDVLNKPEVKTVKFADEVETKEIKAHVKPSPPKIIYEGPLQKVGANFIILENNYTINKLRGLLFGKQSIPVHNRFEVEPLVRIKQTPGLTSMDPSDSLNLPDLSVLESFPEFGNFEKVHREITTVETVKDMQITLKTEAPTGIYLPSGQRKICLITGKPAMYFDPKTGMPYADVESYKVIKEIQEGVYKWSEGGYVSNYCAKGVPAGFDTF